MTKKQTALKVYSTRRNFKVSPEPVAPKRVKKGSQKHPIFVIQKHSASHLHYDFRLEIDGVLVSWAVPKGPSLNPAVKRLAMPTEDHPMAYAHFEGTIPEGSYGAGTVMVWDIGTYYSIKEKDGQILTPAECLRRGTLEIFLEGTKLQGAYALIRTKRGWLLIKMKDEYAHGRKNPVTTQTKSALTGRTMTEILRQAQDDSKGDL